jgi:3-isopropylmalate dehydrogenase
MSEAGYRIAVLSGDGIGREVTAEAVKVLQAVGECTGRPFDLEYGLVGGAAMDETGEPLPAATLALCRSAAAVLLGAVGDPKYDEPQAQVRPEQALLGLRKALNLFANLRPVWAHSALSGASPLQPNLVHGVDLIVVRELTGGIYFGEPRIEGVPNCQGPAAQGDIGRQGQRPCHLAPLADGRDSGSIELSGRDAGASPGGCGDDAPDQTAARL